jgi:hypothetical protein
MAEATAMKATTEQERTTLRTILGRGEQKYTECPCGWFYIGAKCPDQKCKKWKIANGTKRVKLYVHGSKEAGYDKGEELGLTGDALRTFSYWGTEITFEADVNMETGEVTLLSVDGQKILPTKG